MHARTGEIVEEDSTGVVVRSFSTPHGAEEPSDRFLVRVKDLEVDAERVDLEECDPP